MQSRFCQVLRAKKPENSFPKQRNHPHNEQKQTECGAEHIGIGNRGKQTADCRARSAEQHGNAENGERNGAPVKMDEQSRTEGEGCSGCVRVGKETCDGEVCSLPRRYSVGETPICLVKARLKVRSVLKPTASLTWVTL